VFLAGINCPRSECSRSVRRPDRNFPPPHRLTEAVAASQDGGGGGQSSWRGRRRSASYRAAVWPSLVWSLGPRLEPPCLGVMNSDSSRQISTMVRPSWTSIFHRHVAQMDASQHDLVGLRCRSRLSLRSRLYIHTIFLDIIGQFCAGKWPTRAASELDSVLCKYDLKCKRTTAVSGNIWQYNAGVSANRLSVRWWWIFAF